MTHTEFVKQFYELQRRFKCIHHRDVVGEVPRSEFMVLAKLIEHQADMTVSQLSHKLNVSNPAISRMLKQLETKHWIERLPHHEDRRNILVHLTQEGSQTYHQTVQLVSQQKANCLADIELAELEQFIHIGHKIADALMTCKEETIHETTH